MNLLIPYKDQYNAKAYIKGEFGNLNTIRY